MSRLEEFLKELSELTQKYELEIGGCGCCGSPWIENTQSYVADNLYYDKDKQRYEADILRKEGDE